MRTLGKIAAATVVALLLTAPVANAATAMPIGGLGGLAPLGLLTSLLGGGLPLLG
jgi:hypothetical protein